jgi:hypothetical protein
VNAKLTWLGLGLLATTAFIAPQAAMALNGPSSIAIDGGPLGNLAVSGGFDGQFYYQSGSADKLHKGNSLASDYATGADLNSLLLQLKKTDGVVRFTFQLADFKAFTLGAGRFKEATTNHFTLGPVRNAYVTLVPMDGLKISAGQMGSLEGYESTFPWNNPTDMNTIMYYVTNSDSRGVQVEYSTGPIDVTVLYGDGTDSGVFNYLQAAGTYTFDDNNNLNVSAGIPLGTTGPAAYTYGQDYVGDGNELAQNYSVYSVWYSFTAGNLNLVPEVQYAYANANHHYWRDPAAVIPKFTSNFGAALFAQYNFGTSPYSIGAWGEYAGSHGDTSTNTWFLAPDARIVGFSVAPAWQYKDVFARVNAGYVHILSNTGAFGNSGTGKDQFVGTLEGGLVF